MTTDPETYYELPLPIPSYSELPSPRRGEWVKYFDGCFGYHGKNGYGYTLRLGTKEYWGPNWKALIQIHGFKIDSAFRLR